MAKRTTPTVAPPSAPALLLRPRDEVRGNLVSRQEQGLELKSRNITSQTALDQVTADYNRWDEYNTELLRRSFSTDEYASAYARRIGMAVVSMYEPSLSEKASRFVKRLDEKLNYLASLAERLDLIDEVPGLAQSVPDVPRERPIPQASTRVFIVHGHDEEAKAIVARFVEKCGLDAIILHEQPDQGRTVIEKFEQVADVGFAIILLTPDDLGGSKRAYEKDNSTLLPRARQNVVLELGYFIGRLGRSRVCALKKGEVELPSDVSGVVYTPLGADEGWKMKVAKELRAAGYEIDLNTALG